MLHSSRTASRLGRRALRWGALSLPLVLSACSSSAPSTEPSGGPAKNPSREGSGTAIELLRSPERDQIAELEDRRSLGDGRLLELAAHRNAGVRARAVTALGRFPFPGFASEVTNPICRALEDPEVEVRIAAAFALGLRGDPASGGNLMANRNDPDPRIRSRVVEAISRLDDPALHRELLTALRDTELIVRIEAVVGTARWSPEDADADEVDRALLDALQPYRLSTSPQREAPARAGPELTWRILFSLARRHSEIGRGAFLEYALSPVPLERIFAVRGLAQLLPRPDGVALLSSILHGEVESPTDWRVAFEAAVGLGRYADPAGLDALIEAVEHESAHVRAAALEGLGMFPKERQKILTPLRRGLLDLSTSVNAAALQSLVPVVSIDDALLLLQERLDDEDAIVRAGVAKAAGRRDDAQVLPLLSRLSRDRSRLVAAQAIEALAGRPGPEVHGILRALLEHEDNGIRLSAVVALREKPEATDVAALETAFRTSTGEVSAEVAFNVLDTLAAIGGGRARALHEEAAGDPRTHVRQVARRNLAEIFGVPIEAETPAPIDPGGPVPLPGRGYRNWRKSPMVEIRTSRGSMVFELFPAEAPLHTHNFLKLAAAGHYDGLIFHRVVPDFVVQGGDRRGDGNGAYPWRGESLRQEFTPRKYVRGSLGMPRNEDPDSGGSQFFITHRPTPHLDGAYTVFGELRSGGEVLDRVQMGDHILGVRLLD
jgi:cyclophilin family peptidyl-prolyl cis-trans isomerase/HEAT repeat protein